MGDCGGCLGGGGTGDCGGGGGDFGLGGSTTGILEVSCFLGINGHTGLLVWEGVAGTLLVSGFLDFSLSQIISLEK